MELHFKGPVSVLLYLWVKFKSQTKSITAWARVLGIGMMRAVSREAPLVKDLRNTFDRMSSVTSAPIDRSIVIY